mmetsp:Transcript_104078/g.264291  ORF Transcript_104078/g.264291 Transcript_104078/m.264291 type:complete len:136 (+) Transcript_104078:923-1330(+)
MCNAPWPRSRNTKTDKAKRNESATHTATNLAKPSPIESAKVSTCPSNGSVSFNASSSTVGLDAFDVDDLLFSVEKQQVPYMSASSNFFRRWQQQPHHRKGAESPARNWYRHSTDGCKAKTMSALKKNGIIIAYKW